VTDAFTEDAMPLMDRFREQAAQLAQKTQEAALEGRAMLDQAQARRRADAMFRDLGAAVYAERTGRGGPDGAKKIERLIKALTRQEAEQGLGENPPPAGENPPPPGENPPPPGENPPPPGENPPPPGENPPPPAGT
jgi:hypothetical protein